MLFENVKYTQSSLIRTSQIRACPTTKQHDAVAESASKQNGNDNGCVHGDF